MYCGSEYGTIAWKLSRTPMRTIISDANRICLKQIKKISNLSDPRGNILTFKSLNGSCNRLRVRI